MKSWIKTTFCSKLLIGTLQSVLDENLTLHFCRFYDKFISVNAPERRKMGLHVTSSAEGVDFTEDEKIIVETVGQKVSEIQKFKAQFPLKPITQPFVELESLRRST